MIIKPNWQAPAHIKAYSSTRKNGYSLAPFASLNLGAHVGDNPLHVQQNREQFQQQLPAVPIWLEQTHSNCACDLDHESVDNCADASYSARVNTVCAVLTADCLPLLVCDRQGTRVAAIHAGWRGLLNNVIENTLEQGGFDAAECLIWLAPAISVRAFEVGIEVYQAFCRYDKQHELAFKPGKDSLHFYADIYQLARQRLQKYGIPAEQISGGDYCTYSQKALFFSYRRDGQTGRMAALIWRES